jgi:hypothetical protein
MKEIENYGKWFKEASFIDLTLTIDTYIVKDLMLDTIKMSGLIKRLDLAEEALACILANLYKNKLENIPTIIPKGWQFWWNIKKSCGIEWATIDRVRTLLNALLKMDYIDEIRGVNTEQHKYISKYWLKDDDLLFRTIDKEGINPIIKKGLNSSILVRDDGGNSLNWTSLKCNKKKTRKMIADINRYNKLLNQQDITFEISLAEITLHDNLSKIMKNFQHYVNVNTITLSINKELINNIRTIKVLDKEYLVVSTISNKYVVYNNSISIVDSSSIYNNDIYKYITLYMELGGLEEQNSELPSKHHCFGDLPNLPFLLSGSINFTTQTRIFSRSSFGLGGRFYGGAWNKLPKIIRNKFRINGEPVETLDYDGIHIRMLYHLNNKQFLDETYVYDKGTNPEDRERMKLISLIMINAKSHEAGVCVINRKFKKKGLFVSKYYTYKLIKKFKEYHNDISEYFFNDAGVKLQNYDSNIMFSILTKLTKSKIPALSVHDEVIFTTKHKELVEKYMLEEYEREIGFSTTVS